MGVYLLTPESSKLPFVQESQMSLALTSHEAQAFPSGFGIFSSYLSCLLLIGISKKEPPPHIFPSVREVSVGGWVCNQDITGKTLRETWRSEAQSMSFYKSAEKGRE